MNQNLTEIVVILDKSGSMGPISGDTIGGFNSFLKTQQESADGEAKLTLVTFNSDVQTVIDNRDIKEVEELNSVTYRPGGGTSLLDAIGITINKLEDRYTDETDASKIPAKVMLLIITDGEENTSIQFTSKEQIAKMVKHQTNRHGWEIVFLGANLDSVREGRAMGVTNNLNFTASRKGISDTFSVLSASTSMYRSSGAVDYVGATAGTSLEDLNTQVANGGEIYGGTIKGSDLNLKADVVTFGSTTININELSKAIQDEIAKGDSGQI